MSSAASGDEAAALEILKWTVAADRPAPVMAAVDEEILVELALHHRLVQRLSARLDCARPAWCPPRLRTRLRVLRHQAREHTRERMSAAREICHAMAAQGLHPPLFVKGFAAYALTADPENLHFSGDMDTFAEDLPAFWNVLHGLGYAGKRKDTHEWAKLRRGAITLDVHQYFPVLSYPDAVRAAPAGELEAWRNPGRWRLPTAASDLMPRVERIRWEDLIAGAARGATEETKELLFPSPTLLCLIHAVHCFRNCVTRLHYLDPLGGFRLGELRSIFDLAHLPGFDAEQFRVLARRFAAPDAVRLVNVFAQAFLGKAALPEADAKAGELSLFPEHLLSGGWVSLQQTDDWLLRRDIGQMLGQLDASVVPAHCSLNADEVPRLLTCGAQVRLLARIDIAWDASEESVVIDWEFADGGDARADYELLVHFGFGSFVQVRLDAKGAISGVVQKSDFLRPDQQATAETEDGRAVRMICPVPPNSSQPVPCAATTLPLLLALRRLRRESADAACYLPICLTR